MHPRTRARVERIREKVQILQVLEDLGYHVRADGGDREQQFSCALHGDGSDTKPSSRVYPNSDSAYCYACGKSRDVIEFFREKKGLSFKDALRELERAYRLPPLPWVADEPEENFEAEIVRSSAPPPKSFEDAVRAVKSGLQSVTTKRSLPMLSVLALWEAFDRTVYAVTDKDANPRWPEPDGVRALLKVRDSLEAKRAGK